MRDPAQATLAFVACLILGGVSASASPGFAQSLGAEPAVLPEVTGDAAAPDPVSALDPAETADQLSLSASDTVTRVSEWVLASGDNHGMPYLIVDKPHAQVFVFDSQGVQLGGAPALLGIAKGDDDAPGVGDLALSKIPMDERTTPAGRFVARLGPASDMDNVLWVDYDASLSLHPVITSNPEERRLQRLRSPSPGERRISHGCINVPTSFYENVVRTAFARTPGVVYILPDTKPLGQVFPGLASEAQAGPEALLAISDSMATRTSVEDTLGTEESAAPRAVQAR